MPFRLARKREIYLEAGGGRPMRFIDSIDPAGEADTLCISVAAPDSLYVTDDFLVTHNTLNEAFHHPRRSAERDGAADEDVPHASRLRIAAVVTGDITQIDLAEGQRSGLVVAREILREVEGLAFVDFDDKDVVRHELVARIVRAYEKHEKQP